MKMNLKRVEFQLARVFLLVFTSISSLAGPGDDMSIISFSPIGQLVWSNNLVGSTCQVQWAQSLVNPAFVAVPGLENVLATNTVMTVSVPFTSGAGAPPPLAFIRIERPWEQTLGLVAYYPFDNNANDLSGLGNNPVVTNNIQYETWSNGMAAVFDGSTSYIDVPQSASLSLTGPLTIAAWVNPVSEGSLNCIVDKDYSFTGYNLYISSSGVVMRISGTNVTATVTAGTVPLNLWSHVAGVYTGTEIRLYVNGSLVGSTPAGSLANYPKDVYIGMWGSPGSGRYFAGAMSDVRIYNRPLAPSEIALLASLGE